MNLAKGTDRLLEVCFWLAVAVSTLLVGLLAFSPTMPLTQVGGGLAVLAVVFTQYNEWHDSDHSWAGRASFITSVGLIVAAAPLAVVYVPQEVKWYVPPIALYMALRAMQFLLRRARRVSTYVADGFRQ